MTDQNTQTLNQNSTDNFAARLDALFSQLPDHAYDWIFSEQITQNVEDLAKKFLLTPAQTKQLAEITGRAILKEIPLADILPELKSSLGLDESAAKQLAIATALSQFLVIRDHLRNTEDLILQLGGTLPTILPPLAKLSLTPNTQSFATAKPAAAAAVIQKTLRQLAKEAKDSLNQPLTSQPIKIADFDQPVRPTVKNWLVDYVKIKGAGHHESLERSDYLFKSQNAQALSDQERNLVSKILQAYDDDLPLPVNEQTQNIILEKLAAAPPETTGSGQKAAPPAPAASLPAQPAPAGKPAGGDYREPISQEDLAGPLGQPPAARPAPRLSGNVIDLKDLK